MLDNSAMAYFFLGGGPWMSVMRAGYLV